MFDTLEKISEKPRPFEFYTAEELWADEYTSSRMLAYHLDTQVDVSSRRGRFIDRSVEWIASRFDVGEATRVVDFGCGPGLYSTRLAKHGANVTGIDFSPRSIEYARAVAAEECLDITYVNQNYLEFETDDRFDLALMIMCDFCALSPSQRREMLDRFYRLLRPGGAVLLDVYSLNAFEQTEETATYGKNLLDGFWSPDPYHGFLNVFKYEEEKVILDKYTIVEAHRTRTVYNWLQYFSPESLAVEFEAADFVVESVYTNVAGTAFDETASEFAVVGRARNT